MPTPATTAEAGTHGADATPKVSAGKKDLALEGLRGLAAVSVFYHHLMVSSVNGWSPPSWLTWPVDASAAVMIFFVLSGYVIGLTHGGTVAPGDIRNYAWRRFVRLMPINFLGVFLGCALAVSVDWRVALTNLFFLENYSDYAGHWIPVLDTNSNLWSLNYEVLYYALFVLIWIFRPSLKGIGFASAAIMLLGWYTRFIPVFLACYAAGFLFWLTGLGLAWHGRRREDETTNWPSFLLLALVTWKLHGAHLWLSTLPMPRFAGPVVRMYYVEFLPVTACLLAMISRRTFRGLEWLKVLSVAIPLSGFAANLVRGNGVPTVDLGWMACAYVLSLVLWRWRPSLNFFRTLAPLGAISFALYALSRPIQEFICRHGEFLPGGALGFIGCGLVVTTLSFVTAWYVERRIQPAIQRAASAPRRRPTG